MPCDGPRYDPYLVISADGSRACAVPRYRERLPSGVSYDTLDVGYSSADDYSPVVIPPGHVSLMRDNRDDSADSRVQADELGLGISPIENHGGRAEFTTFSLTGSTNSIDSRVWFRALRSERAGLSLRRGHD